MPRQVFSKTNLLNAPHNYVLQQELQQRAEKLELERLKLEEELKKKLIEDKKKQKKDTDVQLEGPKVPSGEASHPSSTTKGSSNTGCM